MVPLLSSLLALTAIKEDEKNPIKNVDTATNFFKWTNGTFGTHSLNLMMMMLRLRCVIYICSDVPFPSQQMEELSIP